VSPYGFVGKYQGLKCKDIQSSCTQIIEAILDKPIADRYKQIMVDTFIESTSFIDANEKAEQLKPIKTFSDSQLNDLVFGYLSNDQVRGSWQGGGFVRNLVKENENRIYQPLMQLYKTYQEEGDSAFYPENNLIDRYIKAILKKKPNLTSEAIKDLIQQERVKHGLSYFAGIYKVIENLGINYIEL